MSVPIQEQGATAPEKLIEKKRNLSNEQATNVKETKDEREVSIKTADVSLTVLANDATRKPTKITMTSISEDVNFSITCMLKSCNG